MTGGELGPHVAEARLAMGTRFEVVLPGEDRSRLLAAAEAALDEIERVEAQLSMYREESELSGINARAAGEPVRVEPRLFNFLRLAVRLAGETDGSFDLTIRPLLQAWGFVGGSGHLPQPEEVEAARALTGYSLVHLDEEARSVRFLREGVSLDLGAIGKGYGIDRAREALEDAGVACALIHAGTSTVYAVGNPPGEPGWRVALRDPAPDGEQALGTVLLRDRALSVSAPHGKAFREGERLFGHVLDPRTGEPARAALLAAAAHASATLTDALSTALLVLGEPGLQLLAERFSDADFLVVPPAEGGRSVLTAGPDCWRFRERE